MGLFFFMHLHWQAETIRSLASRTGEKVADFFGIKQKIWRMRLKTGLHKKIAAFIKWKGLEKILSYRAET